MKKFPYRFLLPLGIVFVVLAVVLYFFHPLAPLFLLASLLIQIPIVLVVSRVNMNKGYEDRSFERRLQYQQDGDAAAFFAAEEREAGGAGFAYWSPRAKALSRLCRAELLCELRRGSEAAELLAAIDEKKLDKAGRQRFDAAVAALRAPENKNKGDEIN